MKGKSDTQRIVKDNPMATFFKSTRSTVCIQSYYLLCTSFDSKFYGNNHKSHLTCHKSHNVSSRV